MKKIYFALFAIVVMMASGCEGFLDENPKSSFIGVEAYANPKLVYINCVASLYVPRTIPNLSEFDQVLYYFDNCAGDMVITPGRRNGWVDGGPHQQIFQHDIDQTFSKLADAWNSCYTYIALCNRSLDQVKQILEDGGDEAVLNPYISEISILRDIYYMVALDYWGRIPIVESAKSSIADVKQSSRSEALAWLINDVSSLIPNLPSAQSQKTGEFYGRMTKAIGYTLLMKLALNSPIWSLDNWENSPYIAEVVKDNYPDAHGFTAPVVDGAGRDDDSKIFPPELIKTGRYEYNMDGVFDKVTAAGKAYSIKCPDGQTRNAWETVIWCQKQIEAEGYKLSTNFQDNFTANNDATSSENIFVMPMDEDAGFFQSTVFFSMNFDHAKQIGIAIACNGPISTIQFARLCGYDPDTMTAADPRMGYTVYYGLQKGKDGEPLKSTNGTSFNENLVYYPEYSRLDYQESYAGAKWDYLFTYGGPRGGKKRDWDFSVSNPAFYNNSDRVVWRYADCVLAAAEAYKRLGDEANCVEMFNKIRTRAHVETYASVKPSDLLDERAREFAWEYGRRTDLVRFGMFTLPTDDKFVGVPAHSLGGKFKEDPKGVTTVYPIPLSVLQLNSNLTQNPWK